GIAIPLAGQAGSWRARPIRLLIVLVVTGAGLAGCTGGGDRDPGQAWISVSPLAALVDQPVVVTVRGCPRGRGPPSPPGPGTATGSPGRPAPSSRRARPGRHRSGIPR